MRPKEQHIIQTKSLVLCYGIREGTTDDWDFLNSLLPLSTTTTSNKLSILRGLACSKKDTELYA